MSVNQIVSKVVLSIGSNYSDREKNVAEALAWLGSILEGMKRSSIYETPDVAGHSANYFNAVAMGETSLSIEALDLSLKDYELRQGRDAEARRKGHVPVDIDIVIWNGEIKRPRDFRHDFFRIGFREIRN